MVSSNGITEAVGNGQHILERHVGLSDNQLIFRLKNSPKITGASTFTDDIIADTVVNSALMDSKNISRINTWLSKGANGNLPIFYKGNTVIGRGVSRGSNIVSDMTNARVILKGNGKGGYNILTAYPTKK